MSDSYSDFQQQGVQSDPHRINNRGNRNSNREGGGFRIRLSDNEMRSARALQEAFNLRSTVAVLGFAVRTLGQMLNDGLLNELIEQHKSQVSRGNNRRDSGGRGRRFEQDRQSLSNRGPKPDPLARPSKPKPDQASESILLSEEYEQEELDNNDSSVEKNQAEVTEA